VTKPSPEAVQANDAGVELADQRSYHAALPHYERAIPLAPTWYAPHLNLGIACKHTGDWARSLAASVRALELDEARAGSGAYWNAGVAATALGDWARARWAWSKVGVPVPPGEGPIDLNIGATPIRVSPQENPEVVWCHRIDPARARIESIPMPESLRRYGDLLLHDGEPRGKRRYRERELSVFDELALLERSPFRTYALELSAPSESHLEELYQTVSGQSDAALEDWTASLEILCAQCSAGVPHSHRERPDPAWQPERRMAVATTDERVFSLIVAWARGDRRRAACAPVLLLE
jgi:tetratricopeptide (TPR) repeat protein